MMQLVSKRNVLAAILTIVFAVLTLAPASMANHRHYRIYHGHYYHHHSKLKGALIGGAGGALIGGLAGHGKGALIGGAAGAGTGYLVQRYRNHRERQRIAHYRR